MIKTEAKTIGVQGPQVEEDDTGERFSRTFLWVLLKN